MARVNSLMGQSQLADRGGRAFHPELLGGGGDPSEEGDDWAGVGGFTL